MDIEETPIFNSVTVDGTLVWDWNQAVDEIRRLRSKVVYNRGGAIYIGGTDKDRYPFA